MEAKNRYGLVILNYMLTSNHIHLLVVDDGDRDVIPRSIQLMAGRTASDYNQRKRRKGAFWEDRYHAAAVERRKFISIQSVVEISAMGRTTAFFIPWPGTLPDQLNSLHAQMFFHGARCIQGFNPRKIVPPARHRKSPAHRTQVIDIGVFIPHDTAGHGGQTVFF